MNMLLQMLKKYFLLSFVCLLLLSLRIPTANSAAPVFDSAILDDWPILHNGRVKPLQTVAAEFWFEVSQKRKFELAYLESERTWVKNPQQASFFLLSVLLNPAAWEKVPFVSVPFQPLKLNLQLPLNDLLFSYSTLIENTQFWQETSRVHDLQKDNTAILENLDLKILDVEKRLQMVQFMAQQELLVMVPVAPTHEGEWVTLKNAEVQEAAFWEKWQRLKQAFLSKEAVASTQIAQELNALVWQRYQQAQQQFADELPNANRIRTELFYNALQPFTRAWNAYVAALFLLALLMLAPFTWTQSKGLKIIALVCFASGFILHALGILLRSYIGGRAPVSNIYESILWVGFIIAIGACLFFARHRQYVYLLVGSFLSFLALVIAANVPLSDAIVPVQAVLVSSWLTYHVLTIVGSYGILAISCGLAHWYGLVNILALLFPTAKAEKRQIWSEQKQQLAEFIYTTNKLGTVMLGAGIIMGAIWADASWGRYWAFDPKETWSLITFLGYMALVHARLFRFVGDRGYALGQLICFGLVVFTYYGVNYFLVGLHSYAGPETTKEYLPNYLLAYLLSQILVALAILWPINLALKNERAS